MGKSQWVNYHMPKPENKVIAHKSIDSLDEVKHSTAFLFRVNIDGEKSMG